MARSGKAFGTLGLLPASVACFLCNLTKTMYCPGLSFPLFKSGTMKPPFPRSCVVKINSCFQSDLRIYRNLNSISLSRSKLGTEYQQAKFPSHTGGEGVVSA